MPPRRLFVVRWIRRTILIGFLLMLSKDFKNLDFLSWCCEGDYRSRLNGSPAIFISQPRVLLLARKQVQTRPLAGCGVDLREEAPQPCMLRHWPIRCQSGKRGYLCLWLRIAIADNLICFPWRHHHLFRSCVIDSGPCLTVDRSLGLQHCRPIHAIVSPSLPPCFALASATVLRVSPPIDPQRRFDFHFQDPFRSFDPSQKRGIVHNLVI